MPPLEVPTSTLGIPVPARRGQNQSVDMWLEDKMETDGAEGLWRVHDGIYDLTEFVQKHPGGAEWLELTKGLDITEAFEVHHLSTRPTQLLKKFFVKSATLPRHAPFTFKEDGFYRTLKREVQKVLPTLPKHKINLSNWYIDSFLVILFVLSTVASKYNNYLVAIIAGNFLAFLTIAAHNYFHQKDNFRMQYFNFSLQTYREWRISHVLSHHLHTNTIDDYEISSWEPYVQYLPIKKSNLQKYGQFALAPLLWITGFHRAFIGRIVEFIEGRRNHIKKSDFICFLLPLFMYIFSGESLANTLTMWTFIVMVGSTHLFIVGKHAAHHHPELFHDGDAPRLDYDWGMSQLDAILERKEITGSPFLVLTNFGDHCLHHLFPTLDHSTLEQLYPTFKNVLKQFNTNLRMVSQLDTIYGAFQQLVKVEPNAAPPNLNKWHLDKYK